jgi:DNA-binding response OmpR family regulator
VALLTALVVESDEATASFLSDQLAADGVEARLARTSQHAVVLAGQSRPGLIVLGDLEARRDSFELLGAVRAGAGWTASLPSDIPILVLTAHAGELDVLRAFDAGADDVMAKPFSYVELRARMRALMRRAGGGRASRVIRVGDLEIDTAARSVTVAGVGVRLSRREYELLLELASDPYRVFSKRELLAQVWGFRAEGSTRTLDSHACRLRRKLALEGRYFVVNVWGVGYSLSRPDSSRSSTMSRHLAAALER